MNPKRKRFVMGTREYEWSAQGSTILFFYGDRKIGSIVPITQAGPPAHNVSVYYDAHLPRPRTETTEVAGSLIQAQVHLTHRYNLHLYEKDKVDRLLETVFTSEVTI
jgi:hypothetical protein